MCTAISIGSFSGRNLDVDKGYGEELIITPRGYTLPFRKADNIPEHPAFIGIGAVKRGYPLYFDAVNEHGLYIAGLNYVANAHYLPGSSDKINLAPYELIPYLLAKCRSTEEARSALSGINLVNIPFSRDLPVSELHFFIADKSSSITVEPDQDGISIHDNPVGVLSNNPQFPYHMHNLNNYVGLSNEPLSNRLSNKIPFNSYSAGLGALGLPGDLSSQSRFVRAAFHKLNYKYSGDPCDIFHLLSTVEMPDGSLRLGDSFERTEYTAAVDLEKLIYYFRSYKSLSVSCVSLFNEEVSANTLKTFPLESSDDIRHLN